MEQGSGGRTCWWLLGRARCPEVPHGVPCPQERDSCVCCQARSEPLPTSCRQQSEMLTMFPNPDCRSIRVALKVGDPGRAKGSLGGSHAPRHALQASTAHPAPPQDLLFSVCGLTVFSTIICTLSAVVCCIQIFSLDIVHVVSPSPGPGADRDGEQRSQAGGGGSQGARAGPEPSRVQIKSQDMHPSLDLWAGSPSSSSSPCSWSPSAQAP